MVQGYVLLILLGLANGVKAGEKAIEIASSKGLGLVVAYIFKKEVTGCPSTPSIRKGVGDHIALLYTFSEGGFHEELRRANQILEKIMCMAGEKNVRAKIIHVTYSFLKSLLQKAKNADCIVIGCGRNEHLEVIKKINNLAKDTPILIV